jgi:hypothetical protein
MWRSKLAGGLAALGLVFATTGSVALATGNNNQNSNPPGLSATPELDSSILFGVGLFGLGAVSAALRRIRTPGPDGQD